MKINVYFVKEAIKELESIVAGGPTVFGWRAGGSPRGSTELLLRSGGDCKIYIVKISCAPRLCQIWNYLGSPCVQEFFPIFFRSSE